jgi:hypothetical protein
MRDKVRLRKEPMSRVREQIIEARETSPGLFPRTERGSWKEIADRAIAGEILFFGAEPIEVGRRGIDWSGSHRRHQEWRAQLNRFFQLGPLARAWRETGEVEYARAARDYIEDWLDRHEPYPPDAPAVPAPGDSSLNMAIRLGNMRHPGWLGTLADFIDSEPFDDEFLERIGGSLGWQLEWLRRNKKARGNWRIAAIDCLLASSLRLPETCGRFREEAARDLEMEFAAQILPDGVHEERSAGYHD